MFERYGTPCADQDSEFSRRVEAQSALKLKARGKTGNSVWFGLGMSGLIGWTVAVPTLVGAALGIWADKRFPSSFSWTLMLLATGLIIGCLNAWRWVALEYKAIEKDGND
jgi:ATP synthase protein I